MSTDRWERDRRFRRVVLNRYRSRCAICRCGAESILEAAHIKAVADGGTDDPNNGICLCANHHRMFDKGLIGIDFESLTLAWVDDNVSSMPWYSVFRDQYSGKLLAPCES